MEELLSLQKKYNISDKDMYVLSKLDQNKINEGFIEKTKSATKQEVILKKYRLKLSERQKVLKNLRFSTFHTNEEFVEKYKGAELDDELQVEGKKGMNKLIAIIVVAVLFIVFANLNGKDNKLEKEQPKAIVSDCSRVNHENKVRSHFENSESQVHGISTLSKNGECGFVFVVNGYNPKFGSYTCTVKTEGSNGIEIIDAGCDY